MRKISIVMSLVAVMFASSFALVNDFNWSPTISLTQVEIIPTTDGKTACLINSGSILYAFYLSDAAGSQMYELAKQALATGKTVNVWTSTNSVNLRQIAYIGYNPITKYSPCYGISLSK